MPPVTLSPIPFLDTPDVTAPALRLHETPQNVAAQPSDAAARAAERAEIIDAYWDDLDERATYLMVLLGAGRNNEALTLCAAYLEGVAHALVATRATTPDTFSDETEELSSDPYLSLCHPLQLVRVVGLTDGLSKSARLSLASVFPGPEYTLLHQQQALDYVRSTLTYVESELVERRLWKCTIAYVIYDFIRTQSFERREGTRTIGLGPAFHEGNPEYDLSVPELVALLRGMIGEARERAHAAESLPARD